MDHPNIAKVLDAGQTESGRPYFAMELVNGISVTKYCDQQHLTTKERLDLFVSICQAVQHAHQKGIIHRDLKPSNILVALYDGQPSPKVIDFGVAKATNQSLTDKTMFTQLGQIVGTLEYMSPEQAERNQLDIDTRSDIYSLGVVLYELLTGETPFDQQRLRSAAFEEMLRIIREEEPPRPSTKLSSSGSLPSIAANRQIEPKKLSVLVRGELDWIVMKAMEKDRGRRYETASKFAEDVQNYLNDEAVAACPPSRRYKFQKFARRNKAAIATAVAIVGTLIVGIIGTTWQAIEAGSERDRAVIAEGLAEDRLATVSQQKDEISEEKKRTEEQAAITQAVSDFLQKDLLGMADAAKQVENEVTPDPNIKLLTLLDRAAATIEDRFNDQPLVKAAIRVTLGNTYLAIGRYQEAEEQFRQSLEIRQRVLGPEHPDTLNTMTALANSYFSAGRLDEALTMREEVLTLSRKVLGLEHPQTLTAMNNLANSYDAAG
jgi:tetratricopeptide (TPR) repeat protein